MKKLTTFEQFCINEGAIYTGDKNIALLAMKGFSLHDQIRVFHWQSEIGDLHTALGNFYGDFSDKLDELMEVIMGKYGRFSVKSIGSPAPLMDLSDVNLEEYLSRYISFFESMKRGTFQNDSEINNIIDEVVASILKLKYLSTMS